MTKTNTDTILVQRYPAITPAEALDLLVDLSYLHGRRNGLSINVAAREDELRAALKRHVKSGLSRKSRR